MKDMNFKLNYYFQLYKDSPVINRQKFRAEFIKKHGRFSYLNDLVLMMEQYQFKKYGHAIYLPLDTKTQKEQYKINDAARKRKYAKTNRKNEK